MAACPASQVPHSCAMCMGSPENKAHPHRLAERIAQCRYWGQRMSDLSDLSDDWHRVQSVPCALEFSKYIALTQPSAMSVSVRISPYSSVFPCPQYRHCAMCPASGLATPEPSGGGSLESPSGRQPTVTEADVRPARHFCRRIYKTSCRKRATSGPHRAMLYSSPRL